MKYFTVRVFILRNLSTTYLFVFISHLWKSIAKMNLIMHIYKLIVPQMSFSFSYIAYRPTDMNKLYSICLPELEAC